MQGSGLVLDSCASHREASSPVGEGLSLFWRWEKTIPMAFSLVVRFFLRGLGGLVCGSKWARWGMNG